MPARAELEGNTAQRKAQPMSNWTPGQLAYIDGLCKVHHAPTYTEMAEALSNYREWFGDEDERWSPYGAEQRLLSLADKLRAIGGDNE